MLCVNFSQENKWWSIGWINIWNLENNRLFKLLWILLKWRDIFLFLVGLAIIDKIKIKTISGVWRCFCVSGGYGGHFAGLMAALHPLPPQNILFNDKETETNVVLDDAFFDFVLNNIKNITRCVTRSVLQWSVTTHFQPHFDHLNVDFKNVTWTFISLLCYYILIYFNRKIQRATQNMKL